MAGPGKARSTGSGSRTGSRRKSSGRTPVMEQFFDAKAQYPDALLFFRMGDFYELFYDDAVVAAEALDITLTSRGKDRQGETIPMAGVPHHSAAGYLARLLEQGFKVAICEQLADPSKVKGIVPRGVTQVVTPGLAVDPDTLDARADNTLVALEAAADGIGLAALEVTRSELRAGTVVDDAAALAEVVRLEAREVLIPEHLARLADPLRRALPRAAVRVGPLPTPTGDAPLPEGLRERVGEGGHAAAGAALAYARAARPTGEVKVARVVPYDPSATLRLDEVAVRNLELVQTLAGERRGSLLHLLDDTKTAMGARLLRRRLLRPLLDAASIRRRHDAVEALIVDADLRSHLRERLASISDLERLATRVELDVATPRDLGAVRTSLVAAQALGDEVRRRADRSTDDALTRLVPPTDEVAEVLGLLETALVDEPPVATSEGGIFRAGVHADLDELRHLSSSSKDVLLELEGREREATGIGSLKIKHTRVFGYYLEVTRPNLHLVPDRYRRKQTVANGERFITDELTELQDRILHADEGIASLEAELFDDLRGRVGAHVGRLRALATHLADLDVHAALAAVAHRYDYARPELHVEPSLELTECRHPIVERLAEAGTFVPNDIHLDADGERLMVVTGPNMAGKSTVMRQAALAVVMAQAGSFVPARAARIGIVDRVFTRVGASDNLGAGRSTFMVEMTETASILAQASQRSLVILDEIGRGTSTYDGLAIAWAVAEHLHDVVGCRAMFATHYHELCELAELREGVFLRNVAAREYEGEVVFLHRLVEGAANRSYGVAVARLAGVPELVLARAKAILGDLEAGAPLPSGRRSSLRGQLDLFAPAGAAEPSEVEKTLRELDLERLRPIDARLALERLRGLLED
ncbi:MAG: DNA mismatch repair protein MutS [Sandaracinaceae bacterium]